jgi:hypothetical protein
MRRDNFPIPRCPIAPKRGSCGCCDDLADIEAAAERRGAFLALRWCIAGMAFGTLMIWLATR